MPLSFEGRHVVITGGVGGLGGAVVDGFAKAGAVCHLPVLEPAPANPNPAIRVTPGVNLTDENAVMAFYASLPPLFASIHLAGGFKAAPITETSRADFTRQVELNLVTTFLCCREAVTALRRNGGGRIVNVGSRASEVPKGGSTAYTAAKGAVASFTRALADEVRPDRILVNAVLPSIIDTPANRAAMPSADHGRWPKPAQIGEAILWLASAENQLISGALIPVYGEA